MDVKLDIVVFLGDLCIICKAKYAVNPAIKKDMYYPQPSWQWNTNTRVSPFHESYVNLCNYNIDVKCHALIFS